MKKLLIIGQMGSGKDTVADYLKEKYNFYPAKLGMFIRAHIDEMYPELTTDERRIYYQAYGEGMRDLFGKDFWNERLWMHMDHSKENIMITDCRQHHEIDYWVPKGYIPVAVYADAVTRMRRLEERDGHKFNVESFTHPTEMRANQIIDSIMRGGLEGFVLENETNLNNLYRQIDGMIEKIEACSGVTV